MNDNRNYKYTSGYIENRPEYDTVIELISNDKNILDLGCGEGTLAVRLKEEKKAIMTGIEISPSGVEACLSKGIYAIEGKIDESLPFSDKSFDISVCNVTMQMVNYPEVTLQEMQRVSKEYLLISFPNFGYLLNRLDLLIHGRMPRKMLYGYTWYNTGHIHQFSLSDFKALVNNTEGLKVKKISIVNTGNMIFDVLSKILPNVFAKIIVVKVDIC
ncbi:MAG: methionine biosynthesis protein MetW [Saprospiraceae bacterium]